LVVAVYLLLALGVAWPPSQVFVMAPSLIVRYALDSVQLKGRWSMFHWLFIAFLKRTYYNINLIDIDEQAEAFFCYQLLG
jgi:hypothetical protein